ncbi:MCPVI domain containing protein [Pyrenophora tritici-repentis]|uniref:Periplasmic protein TonB n=2 Tax=Pyrenophora tritici-repentis TaxID=45151 RepID=A0A2W1HNM7_9PLEO|nr:Periplasmic protein TonB [Pyrenophora tritici-repentis]KAI0589288.1 hypothetical protein Alg215_00443 [Pyrenophora tritici-repentis]KAI1511269.1 hypothetical protein Ptr86124_009673 [Pyrenophora tritici-repentis]KAI1667503.1 hypothetical protein L13192_08212 [Pyrenophora tritici-repentis]KAI1679701.1 hypothetical protein KJE20_10341 [Pyrenophora tritici-repentis]
MAPFRNRDRSNRSGRGQIEHNVLEGLPITQYREAEITIEPHSVDAKPLDKDAWPELPMPRDSHMLPEHSQQILRAARSGRVYKPPAPPEDDNEMKDEEEESKEIRTGFTIKKYVKVPRHLEVSEPEYLAKRRKGLPSPYVQPTQVVAQPVLRETKVKKLDAEGNVSVYKVLVPEGQVVEGEVQPTDAALEVAPATAVPGTIVEGVGVVNAEGVIVANDIMQQTPPRRRPPPPKKKNKRGGPGRGRKRVIFAEGATEQGTPVSNASGDMLGVPNVKREDGSVAPSDGGDTPMGDAGGEEEEGSGEEGSEDEDQDMERTSTPATPLISSVAPTSAPTMETTTLPETTPAEVIKAPTQAPATTSAPSQDKPETARAEKTVVVTGSSQTMQQTEERDPSSSPDLPLSSTSHSPQNSLNQIPTPVATTDAVVPEEALSELPAPTVAPTVEKEAVPEPVVAPQPKPKTEPESAPEAAPAPAPEPAPEPEPAPVQEPAPQPAPESIPEPVDSEMVMHSAPTSEPDLMGSLERQLEKDNEDMTES